MGRPLYKLLERQIEHIKKAKSKKHLAYVYNVSSSTIGYHRNKKKARARQKRWYLKNRLHCLKVMRAYRERNKEAQPSIKRKGGVR